MKSLQHWGWLLLGIGWLVYLPSWFNGFVWDDEEQIVNNPFVKSFSGISQVFAGSTFGGGGSALPSGGYYKPLMSVWYMLNSTLFGDWAGGFHLTQSLLHAMNAVMFYLILARLTKRPIAAVASIIWLIHPANVESVAYAASAQEVLASFFGLLSLWVVMKRKEWRMDEITSLFVAAGLILLSLLSKESGIVFPLAIISYLLIVEKNYQQGKFFGMFLIPVVLAYAGLRFGVAKIQIEPNLIIPVAQLSLGERLMTVPETLWQHIRVSFWPVNLYIGHHQVVTQFGWKTAGQFVAIIGLLAGMALINIRQKNRAGWFFWVWLLASTGIVSNLYPLDMTYAERWSYMPILALLGWAAVNIRRLERFGRLEKLVAVVIVGLLIGRNVTRQLEWHDGLRLFGHDIKYAQNAFDLENNYGVELMRAGRMEDAKIHFEKSMLLAPKWWTPPNNLGVVYQRLGDEDKAAELYRQSIAKGNYFLAYQNLAAILVKRNDPEAAQVVEAGLKQFPYNQELLELAYYLSSR